METGPRFGDIYIEGGDYYNSRGESNNATYLARREEARRGAARIKGKVDAGIVDKETCMYKLLALHSGQSLEEFFSNI